jgi:DNA-binding transcriptional LysR family regulator
MEWQQLEHFREVARTEHFTKAAKRLNMTQPALSRSIGRLEEELGVRLFDRSGRTVQLNKFGKMFLSRVDRAFREIDQGIQELRQMNDPYAGSVSLGFLLTFGFSTLPDIISKFNRIYPNVEFKLHQNTAPVLADQLARGEVDLCLLHPLEDQRGWVWNKLFEEELFIYVPVSHRLADQSAVRLAMFAGDPFIGFKKNYGMRVITDRLCREAGFAPQIKFEGDDVATAAGLVSAGLGVALLPDFAGIDPGKVKKLRVTEPVCRRELGLAWMKDRTLSRAAELFRTFILDYFSKTSRYSRNML